jgi:lysophospholipase L1-like esterase
LGKEIATEPYPRTQDYIWMSKNEWCGRVIKVLNEPNRAEGKIGFMGDSISQGWPREYLAERFGAWKPVKMGIGGDKTQNLLWRIDHGELKGMILENLVLQIGTNNLDAGDSPEVVAKAIKLVIERIQRDMPKVHIILTAILPRGKEPTDPLRAKINATNRILSASAGVWKVGYMDIGSQLLEKDGTISSDIMADYVHPTVKGYRIWADAIANYLQAEP